MKERMWIRKLPCILEYPQYKNHAIYYNILIEETTDLAVGF